MEKDGLRGHTHVNDGESEQGDTHICAPVVDDRADVRLGVRLLQAHKVKCRCSVHHVYAAPIASIIFDTFDSGHVQAQRERNKRQQDRVCMKLFMSYIDLKDVCSPGVYMLEEVVNKEITVFVHICAP